MEPQNISWALMCKEDTAFLKARGAPFSVVFLSLVPTVYFRIQFGQ